MLIDHIEIPVSDPEMACRFYEAALKPLGINRIISVDAASSASGTARYGLGKDGYPRLWLHGGEPVAGGLHIAFATPNRSKVDAFHAAAIAAGGHDNGAPGIRARYHSNYYAAFVLDLDGNNIEAVCQSE